MNTTLECIPCFFRQALFAARAATDDEGKAKQVLDRIAALVPDIPLNSPPPETARHIYRTVRDITGVEDPFTAHKKRSIENALSLYGDLKALAEGSLDPLLAAVRIAIAGNVIDLGANPDYDLEGELNAVMERPLALDHYASFRQSTERAGTVLYLGDNAGESVLDRILIDALGKDTVYVVRDIPIINDVTVEDAEKSGIGQSARIMSSGCDAPGTILRRCSREFLDLFENADLIISKGQGNLESLSGEKAPIFYLLKVKCPVIARHLDLEMDGLVLKDARL